MAYTLNTLGESGHILVDPDGDTLCACGGRGCLEAVAASPAIRQGGLDAARCGGSEPLRQVLESTQDLTARDVAAAAAKGDPAAQAILDRAGRFIGIALTSYLHLFAPSIIVLGGGVSLAGDLILGSGTADASHRWPEPITWSASRALSPRNMAWMLARLAAPAWCITRSWLAPTHRQPQSR